MYAAMDTVAIVAMGVLGAIFLASLIGLIVVCKHRYCKASDLLSRQHSTSSSPSVTLVEHMEPGARGVEMGDVGITADIATVLHDSDWCDDDDDHSSLGPHSLAVLKLCHELTERLVAVTMTSDPETLEAMVSVARQIGPRVDDVVTATAYPPRDPRLLEARCTALVLSVQHLALMVRSVCCLSPSASDWIDRAMDEINSQLVILREASQNYEENSWQAASTQSDCSAQATGQSAGHNSPPKSEEARV